MRTSMDVPLAQRTTLRLGGPARRLVQTARAAEVVAVVRAADARAEPMLLLGGGSNLVVADEGFDGTVVDVGVRGLRVALARDGGARVRAAAGEDWDAFVSRAVGAGWAGVEALSGIPGRVGAVPLQNVGAYGQEVADTIVEVEAWDRTRGEEVRLSAADCVFGYRTSRLKSELGRFVVLGVSFGFDRRRRENAVRYAELALRLGVEVGQPAPLADIRDAVLALRRSKGMVLDDADPDTWSAGSFFTNPMLERSAADQLPPEAPRWDQPGGRVKTSAGWLIQRAGFSPGYGNTRVQVSSKHPLALTNRGGATTAELLAVAREIRDGVEAKFGVTLVNEPVLVGCSL
jgi:UDP-N-acetylmuramate dehydrogenase